MPKDFISPKGIHEALGYSHVVKVGNTLYLSGKVGRDEQGKVVVGFEAQAQKAFENIQVALEAAGASLKDIVKLTIYVTNIDDMPKFRDIRNRFLSPPFPASTAVEVARLATGVLVEIDVAVLSAGVGLFHSS
jgi:2-iminobutanoate/2-iminopropanoate deaminase